MASPIRLLSSELLASILENVLGPDDTKRSNVVSSLLVCRAWNVHALPILYRNVVLHGDQIGRFLTAFDRGAAFSNTHSLTIYTANSDGATSPSLRELIDGWMDRLAAEVLCHMHPHLHSLSLVAPGFRISSLPIATMLRALPVSCVDLELDTTLHPQSAEDNEKVHICDEIRALLPRMRRIRISLDPVCSSLLGTHKSGKGFRPTPIPAPLVLVVNCIRAWRMKDRCPDLPECSASQSPSQGSWRSMVGGLQHAVDKGLLQAEVVVMGAVPGGHGYDDDLDQSHHTTILRCHASRDGMGTWAFLLGPVPRPRHFEDPMPWYIRTDKGGFVIVATFNLHNVAEGFPWRTSTTGARLPEDMCKDPAKLTDPSKGGIWTEAEWKRLYPRKKCVIWRNEELAGMSLFEAEKKPGSDLRWAIEMTPPGFHRPESGGGGDLERQEGV